MNKQNGQSFYIAAIVLSVIFLVAGYFIARGPSVGDEFAEAFYTGRVRAIYRVDEEVIRTGTDWEDVNTNIHFDVRISTWGPRRGQEVRAVQTLSTVFVTQDKPVEAGDRILLFYEEWSRRFLFAGYARIQYVIVLGLIFLALVVAFGRRKGGSAIMALGLTCLAIFMVFVPAILAGRNIYIATFIICLFAISATLAIVIGPNKKALAALLGCLGGVALAGILMALMDVIAGLTGVLNEEMEGLLFLATENPINLRAVVFAGVILGAVGAIMDVAMSISSSLWELRETGGVTDFKSIMQSGIAIGKDILGTMLNTLILAYIGSSMGLILLITAHSPPLVEILNLEMIIVEFLRALVGSFGMFLTIPLTAAICGKLFSLRTSG